MKYIKSVIIFVFIVFSSINFAGAQSSSFGGGVEKFEILPEYLINGKLKVDYNSSTITFKYKVYFHRQLETSGAANKWKIFDITVSISIPNSSNTPVYYSSHQLTSNDFASNDDGFGVKEITAVVNRSSFITGKPIFLAYQPVWQPSPSVASKSYSFEIINVPTQPSPYNPWWQNSQRYTMPTYSANTPIWTPGNSPVLTRGNSVYTSNGAYFLALQPDGNLVIYRSSNNEALWASGSANKGGENLYFQNDGNLVLYKTNGQVAWSSNIYSNSPYFSPDYFRFVFQDDGNFVMQFVNIPSNFVEVVAESQTYNRKSSHFGSLNF